MSEKQRWYQFSLFSHHKYLFKDGIVFSRSLNIDNSSKDRGVGRVKIEISTKCLVFERFTTSFNFSENLKTFHQELLKLLSHFHFFCIFMIFPRGSGLSYLNAGLKLEVVNPPSWGGGNRNTCFPPVWSRSGFPHNFRNTWSWVHRFCTNFGKNRVKFSGWSKNPLEHCSGLELVLLMISRRFFVNLRWLLQWWKPPQTIGNWTFM